MTKIYNQLLIILKETFPKEKITKNKNPKAGDIEKWDSLGHLNFLLAVEKFYKIKFSMKQMIELKDFNTIIKVIIKNKK